MLAFVFLPAFSGNSHCSALVHLTNTVLLLAANVVGKDLQLEAFVLTAYMLLIVQTMNYFHYYQIIIKVAPNRAPHLLVSCCSYCSILGRNKLIVSIPTSFNCNKVLGFPGFQ
jgi:hypothetical protein